jgi:hypothetical protein
VASAAPLALVRIMAIVSSPKQTDKSAKLLSPPRLEGRARGGRTTNRGSLRVLERWLGGGGRIPAESTLSADGFGLGESGLIPVLPNQQQRLRQMLRLDGTGGGRCERRERSEEVVS